MVIARIMTRVPLFSEDRQQLQCFWELAVVLRPNKSIKAGLDGYGRVWGGGTMCT